MSEFIRNRDFQRVNLSQAMALASEFRPYCFSSEPENSAEDEAQISPDYNPSWASDTVPQSSKMEAEVPDDPFARGLAEGQRIAEAAHQLEREKLLSLISNCQALQDEPSEELAQLLAETVEKLVRQIVEQAPIDAAWLKAQTEIAAAMVAEADKARTLWVNPADAALLYDTDMKLPVEADPAMARGTVRIETSAGWIEHGRAVYLDELRAALGNQAPAL